jgi:hypothetical protein
VYRWEHATASPLLRLQFDDPVSEMHIQADCLAVLSAGDAASDALAVLGSLSMVHLCCGSVRVHHPHPMAPAAADVGTAADHGHCCRTSTCKYQHTFATVDGDMTGNTATPKQRDPYDQNGPLLHILAGQLFLQTLAPSAGQDQDLQRPLPALRRVRTACLSSAWDAGCCH